MSEIAQAAGRPAGDGCHLGRVAAEGGDVVLDPLHGELLVHQTCNRRCIADILEMIGGGGGEGASGEPAERCEPVIDGDDYDNAVILDQLHRGS